MDVEDGLKGVTAVKRMRGATLAQATGSAKSFGMARAAAEAGQIDVLATLEELPKFIERTLRSR